MDIQRSILLVALAIVSYLMVLQWNEDYGQAALPTQSAAVASNSNADLPDAPAVASSNDAASTRSSLERFTRCGISERTISSAKPKAPRIMPISEALSPMRWP